MKNIMTTDIGTINLAEMELVTDCMELFIPIVAVSEKLKSTIEEQTKKAKTEYQKEFLAYKGMKWCDNGTDITYQSLHVTVENHKVSYELCFEITDKENEFIDAGFNLNVDLSEHTEEIKKLIIKAMIDKFF